MPGLSSVAVADEIASSGVPIVLMTGAEDKAQELEEAGQCVLHKPFRLETLYNAVHRLISEAERQPRSAGVEGNDMTGQSN
jgi:DNA-binding response OmpR family regulator